MPRLGALFVAMCVLLIAGAVGATLYLTGLSGAESTIAGLIVSSTLALMAAISARPRRNADRAEFVELSRKVGDLTHQVEELSQRTAALEGRDQDEILSGVTAPIVAEVAELGALVRQLAESVAAHEGTLARVTSAMPASATIEAEPLPAGPPANDDLLARERMTATIRSAIDANRVDLYLQPIVTLPQRKVRYYEALTRLRTEDGRMLTPAEFLGPAESSGLIARLDHMLLLRCVQVLRRLQQKNRDVGLFCNLSAVTLNDPQFFPQMSQFMDENRVLAPSLLIEFKQAAWRAMGPMELESLAALREVGFRFGMDAVTDLRMEPRDLAGRGIRFVKAPAAMLLGGDATGADIHTEDLAGLLGRFGVNLVAAHVESESQVVDLLDFDVKFGQGFLFSPPRPVRAEVLQGLAESKDAPAKEEPHGATAPAIAI